MFIVALSLTASAVFAQFMPIQSDNTYKVFLDITGQDAEKVTVEVVPPLRSLGGDSAIYTMARVIPGTYSISNYGQFVRNITALDQYGDTLETVALDVNRWYFPQANKVYKISYSVVETFAHSDGEIFEPSGTTFRDSVSLLNMFGLVGYMQNNEQYPYELTVQKPREFYGAGNLEAISRAVDRDEFMAANYFFLHDNPLMYCRPDTASVDVNGTVIHLAVYSAAGINTAREILPDITNLFQAASDYFDGSLPVSNYHILLFLEDPNNVGAGYGALEHHYSTVVYMPDYPLSAIRQNIRDIVAHEFLHIVTPLNFHSEVVHNFNFQNPEMTRHLWLYEGVTEYTSHLMQVRGGLIDEEDFIEEMREKMQGADEYNPLVPISTASRYALTVHEDQYLNVYQKGALIAMCIDLQIIAATDGEMDIKDKMVKLGNTY
jgi:predicted metalloprotease with PDZ domain